MIRIRGSEEGVNAAAASIAETCALDKAKVVLPYDERAMAAFFGKNGNAVNALAAELKVSINILRGKKQVVLKGEPEHMDAAKAAVERKLKECIRVEETVPVFAQRIAYLLGPKGSRIRQLQATLGVQIDLPKADAARTGRTVPVTVSGPEDGVPRAIALLEGVSRGTQPRSACRPLVSRRCQCFFSRTCSQGNA